mgnify:CR=1 FL=1
MNEREALKRATEALKAIDLTGIKHQEKPVETVGRIRGIACDALKDIETVLAQPEQEPVALQMDVIVVNLVRAGINKHHARELAEHFIKHTRPQPAAWVGLTDEHLEKLLMDYGYDADDDYMKEMLRDHEAKLREKNGGKA